MNRIEEIPNIRVYLINLALNKCSKNMSSLSKTKRNKETEHFINERQKEESLWNVCYS